MSRPASECRRCGGSAQNSFLCSRCIDEVKCTLAELPWWLGRLTEAAVGQTLMSDNGGRKSAPRRDLDGEKSLAECIEPLPVDGDLNKARRERERLALAHALATGGVNAKASELLGEIADTLGYWCRVLCEARGVSYTAPRPRPWRDTHGNMHFPAYGHAHARWLAGHIDSIAASEDAEDITADILGRDRKRRSMIEQIQSVINRPWRFWQYPWQGGRHPRPSLKRRSGPMPRAISSGAPERQPSPVVRPRQNSP